MTRVTEPERAYLNAPAVKATSIVNVAHGTAYPSQLRSKLVASA